MDRDRANRIPQTSLPHAEPGSDNCADRLAPDMPGRLKLQSRQSLLRNDLRHLVTSASALLDIAVELESAVVIPEPDDAPGFTSSLALARWEYRRRRSRARFFEADGLFGEPAWDMLLDLFIAGREGKALPVTSACIGAAVPVTTALRWLGLLEQRGLVVRQADRHDARRALVCLSAEATDRMERYLQRSPINPGE